MDFSDQFQQLIRSHNQTIHWRHKQHTNPLKVYVQRTMLQYLNYV